MQAGPPRADDLVLLGSPASWPTVSASSGLSGHRVYVGEAPLDPIADLGVFGADPGDRGFGATRIRADAAPGLPWPDELVAAHSRYFDPGSESLRNVARVVVGRGSDVSRPVEGGMSWSEPADAAQRVLADRFWNPRIGIYQRTRAAPVRAAGWSGTTGSRRTRSTSPSTLPPGPGRPRSGTASGPTCAGILRRNGGRIVNRYYDDMAWMAIALLRAEEVAGADTGALVRELWADIRAGWDARHGGIVWRRDDPRPYTNAPANAPSAILAARLHRRYGDPADLDWARRIADWLQATLVDPDSGIVWDGLHPAEDPGADRTLWTYNQGTVVGAEVQLWQADRRPGPPGPGPADGHRGAGPVRRWRATGRGHRRRFGVQGNTRPLSGRSGSERIRTGRALSPTCPRRSGRQRDRGGGRRRRPDRDRLAAPGGQRRQPRQRGLGGPPPGGPGRRWSHRCEVRMDSGNGNGRT